MQVDCPRPSGFVFSLIPLFFFFNLEIQNNSPADLEKGIETYASWKKYLKFKENKEVIKPQCQPTHQRMLQQILYEQPYMSNSEILGSTHIQSYSIQKDKDSDSQRTWL